MIVHPYGRLIPDTQRQNFVLPTFAADRRGLKAAVLEAAYSPPNGQPGDAAHGVFLDLDDSPPWAKPIAGYDRDQWRDEAQGPKRFSEIFDGLPALEDSDDGAHVNVVKDAWQQWQRDQCQDPKSPDPPFTIAQNFGNCVDASIEELIAGILGFRAAKAGNRERFKFIPAYGPYRKRGYCGHGWTLYACARVLEQIGWCPATIIEVGDQRLDFLGEDKHEYACSTRPWCANGGPRWLEEWTSQTYPFDPAAITEFDGRLDALKRLFANGGQIQHGSNYTSASDKPFRLRRIGGHAQIAYKMDWADRTVKFFRDRGFSEISQNNPPVANHQTWGPWSAQTRAEYWPDHWGPQPEGAWICTADQLLNTLMASAFAYLPLVKGEPADTIRPIEPAEPSIDSPDGITVVRVGDRIRVKGELVNLADGQAHVLTHVGRNLWKPVVKPVL